MKRILTLSILLCLLAACAFAATHSDAYPFYMLGHVSEGVQFEMEFSNSVLPFDLTGTDVKYNATTQRDSQNKPLEIRGLYVGTFSLSSNTPNFKLYITHTPLKLIGGNETIDYRLYIQLGSKYGYTVKSCISSTETLDSSASLPSTETEGLVLMSGADSCFSGVWGEGTSYANHISIINTGVYVSLEDKGDGDTATDASTNAVVQAIPAGNYSSNVYLLLVKES